MRRHFDWRHSQEKRKVNSTIAQFASGKSDIDWSVNYGNMSSAIPLYLLDTQQVDFEEGLNVIEIFNTNTGKSTNAYIEVSNGEVSGGGCLAAACVLESTVAHKQLGDVARLKIAEGRYQVEIENPAGVLDIELLMGGDQIDSVRYARNAQVLVKGKSVIYSGL